MAKIIHRDSCRCQEDPEAWKVNAPEYYNCFFTYMRYNSRRHTLSEIAELLGMSIAAVTSIEKRALNKLRNSLLELKNSE